MDRWFGLWCRELLLLVLESLWRQMMMMTMMLPGRWRGDLVVVYVVDVEDGGVEHLLLLSLDTVST